MVALMILEHADAPAAVLAYHALARGLPDLTFRWYNITDEQEGIVPKSTDVYGHAAQGTTSGPAWQAAVRRVITSGDLIPVPGSVATI